MSRRFFTLTALVLFAIAVVAAFYVYRLTAPVAVSNQAPVAPTLSVSTATSGGSSATQQPTTAAASTPAVTPATGSTPAATPAQPTTSSAPAAAQVYRIDSTQSKATYRVNETFVDGNKLAEATGTTNAVSGDILIDRANPEASQVGEIVVDISQLTSDSTRRDNAIRRQWLESAKYPLATFKNGKISDLPASLAEGQEFSFKLSGDMTVRETTKPVVWDVKLTLDGSTLKGTATTTIKLTDFNVEPPDIAGMLKVDDTMELTLDLVANAVQ